MSTSDAEAHGKGFVRSSEASALLEQLRGIRQRFGAFGVNAWGDLATRARSSGLPPAENVQVSELIAEGTAALKNLERAHDALVSARGEEQANRAQSMLLELAMSADEGDRFLRSLAVSGSEYGIPLEATRAYQHQLGELRTLRALLTAEKRVAAAPGPPAAKRKVTVLIHGIRSEGPWGERVARIIDSGDTHASVIRYGYLDVFRFLIPQLRSATINGLFKKLEPILHDKMVDRVSVVAHSFGTYAIACILLEHSYVRLHRLVLCGSIIPTEFPWDRVKGQLEDRVLNECGTRDIWPILAASMTVGFGPSGTFGFGTWNVRDRFHRFRHSDFFETEFVKRAWLPFLTHGEVVEAEDDWTRRAPPWWQSALARTPLWLVLLALLVASASWGLLAALK